MQKLRVLYNAKDDFYNRSVDYLHKVFSPSTYQCDLCKITHGSFGMRKDWQEFLLNKELETEFYYRENFLKLFPNVEVQAPAILFVDHNGNHTVLLSSKELHVLDLVGLIDKIDDKIGQISSQE